MKLLRDNRVIGSVFMVLATLNAYGMAEGWYG